MTKRGYTYNVCGYIGRDRVMKETLTATGVAQALEIGRIVLRRRGFNPSKVRLEVIRLSGRGLFGL